MSNEILAVERNDYFAAWARIRGIASTALVRLIGIIASDQLVVVRPQRRRQHQAAPQRRASLSRRRDMGEVIGFERKKLAEFVPEQVPPPINLAEPITADKIPAWGRGNDTAPSE